MDTSSAAKGLYVTLQEYLELEAETEIRHEYIDGHVYRMSGASRRHNRISTGLTRVIATAARERPNCQVFAHGMKLHVPAHNCVYYPDLFVSCDAQDCDEQLATSPCAIIEVLSPSTSSIDRREKRLSYQSLPSLREYIILDQNRMRAELERKHNEGWRTYWLEMPNDHLDISCLGLSLTLQQIYDGIDLPAGIAEDGPQYDDYWQPGFA